MAYWAVLSARSGLGVFRCQVNVGSSEWFESHYNLIPSNNSTYALWGSLRMLQIICMRYAEQCVAADDIFVKWKVRGTNKPEA